MVARKEKVRSYLETVRENIPEPEKTSEWPHTVRQAAQYMCQRCYEKELTVDKLKGIVYAGNGNGFSSEFVYYVGKLPIEYLNDLRVEAGKQLLAEKRFSNIHIHTIAKELGFSGKGNFHHAFRKREGISPGKWRKKRLRDGNNERKEKQIR